jgi:hypothetical protein
MSAVALKPHLRNCPYFAADWQRYTRRFDDHAREIAVWGSRQAYSAHLSKNVPNVTRVDRGCYHSHKDFTRARLWGLDGRSSQYHGNFSKAFEA